MAKRFNPLCPVQHDALPAVFPWDRGSNCWAGLHIANKIVNFV